MLLDRYVQKKYQAGLKFVLYVAVKKLYNCDIHYLNSIDKGLYCHVMTEKNLSEEDITNLKNTMQTIISENHKISKKVVTKEDAYNYYIKKNFLEKAGNVQNLNGKTVTMYELLGYYNYFMCDMPASTGEIKTFDLNYLENNNLVLTFPINDDYVVPKYVHQELIIKSFSEYRAWLKTQNIIYAADLNKAI